MVVKCKEITSNIELVEIHTKHNNGITGRILTGAHTGNIIFVSSENIIKKELTVLSFGGGQDSTAILLKMIYEKDFREKYAPDELVVIMSDTGNEHDYTYEHVKEMKKHCNFNNIPFFLLTSDMGYHCKAWQNLIDPQMRGEGEEFKPTMVQLGTKSCTDKLKIVPIYKFLDEYINNLMGYDLPIHKNRGCLKRSIKKFYKEEGSIKVLIGFSKGEEKRSIKGEKLQQKQQLSEGDLWEKSIDRKYPLIDIGMDRNDCQKYITQLLNYCPMPSNCMLCPYQSDQELLWLHRNHKSQMQLWINIENRKLKRYAGIIEKNHGVYNNKKTLVDKLRSAIKKYGHMTNDELSEYKMSHGCSSNTM